MSKYQWIDHSQPQTLQIGCWLLYLNAFFALIQGVIGVPLLLGAVAAFFIANEKRWAYWLGVVIAVLDLVTTVRLWATLDFTIRVMIPLVFAIALVVALLHRDSRSYQRVWFK